MSPTFVPSGSAVGGALLLSISWSLTSVCIAIASARCLQQLRSSGRLRKDDWFMVAALLLHLSFQGCITEACRQGLGRTPVHASDLTSVLQWTWISTSPATLAAIATRISATIMLLRIFGANRAFFLFLVIITAIQTMLTLLDNLFVYMQVDPVQGLFNPALPAERWDPRIQQYTSIFGQAFFALSAFTFVLVPILLSWQENMSHRRSAVFAGLASLALASVTASVMKMLSIPSAASPAMETQVNASHVATWSAVEQTISIALACIPSFLELHLRPSSRRTQEEPPLAHCSLASLLGRSGLRDDALKPSTPSSQSSSQFGTFSDQGPDPAYFRYVSPAYFRYDGVSGPTSAPSSRSQTPVDVVGSLETFACRDPRPVSLDSVELGNHIHRMDRVSVRYERRLEATEELVSPISSV